MLVCYLNNLAASYIGSDVFIVTQKRFQNLTFCLFLAMRVQKRMSTQILRKAVTLVFDFANVNSISGVCINWTLSSGRQGIISS